MTARGHHTHRKTGVAALALMAIAFCALWILATPAQATTRTFAPASISKSTALFRVNRMSPKAVRRAVLRSHGSVRRLPTGLVRRGIRSGRLRVHVQSGARRESVKLLIRLRHRHRYHRGHTHDGATPRPSQPTSESQPAPESSPPSIDVSPAEPVSEPVSSPPPSSQIAIPANARYVSASTGSDSSPGTEAAPWRTLTKAVSSASAGDVVVLEPGTYGARGTTTTFSRSGTASAPITFTSAPGKSRAVILGYIRVTGSHLHLDSLLFDGPTGAIVAKTSENPGGEQVQVSIMYGTDVELSNSEVRDNAWHAGVFVSNATGIRVVSNYIHNNGDYATGANLDHGVYWCSGSGIVAYNRIENNVAWGVHLYPTSTDVTVTRNTVTGNDRGGVIVARDSSGSKVFKNIVANNEEYGIRGYYLTGADNAATDNITWNNDQNTAGSGIAFSNNIVANPDSLSSSVLASYGAP